MGGAIEENIKKADGKVSDEMQGADERKGRHGEERVQSKEILERRT